VGLTYLEKEEHANKSIQKEIIRVKVHLELTQKRLVAGSYMTNTPTELTYASELSRDCIHICFLIAKLNDLDIQMSDVVIAYLNAMTKEICYSISGKEFGEDERKQER